MYRSTLLLDGGPVMPRYAGTRERYCLKDDGSISEEEELGSECGSEEVRGVRGVRSCLSLEIHGLQRQRHVYFSNQEFYRRLEELKSNHLRNMAELEKMYISQEDDEDRLSVGSRGRSGKLQRINSQEELDFHDSSSGSDQSELSGGDPDGDSGRGTCQDQNFRSDVLLSPAESSTNQKQLRLQRQASPQNQQGNRRTGVKVRASAKATVPKPFQMMLREEERKRHKVRTRSQVELENTLLRRELEELQECQKKFRASPAPLHTRLPLYEVISQRMATGRGGQSRRSSGGSSSSSDSGGSGTSDSAPAPFRFLEREKKKREAKMAAQLGRAGPGEERQAFRARPVPRCISRSRHKAGGRSCERQQRESTEGPSEPSSDPGTDTETQVGGGYRTKPGSDSCRPCERGNSSSPCSSSKGVKKQIQLSIEMVKEAQWSCNSCAVLQPGGAEAALLPVQSGCISV